MHESEVHLNLGFTDKRSNIHSLLTYVFMYGLLHGRQPDRFRSLGEMSTETRMKQLVKVYRTQSSLGVGVVGIP